jgi:hypothetical protein
MSSLSWNLFGFAGSSFSKRYGSACIRLNAIAAIPVFDFSSLSRNLFLVSRILLLVLKFLMICRSRYYLNLFSSDMRFLKAVPLSYRFLSFFSFQIEKECFNRACRASTIFMTTYLLRLRIAYSTKTLSAIDLATKFSEANTMPNSLHFLT